MKRKKVSNNLNAAVEEFEMHITYGDHATIQMILKKNISSETDFSTQLLPNIKKHLSQPFATMFAALNCHG